MAVVISASVLKMPDGTDFAGASNPCPTQGVPTRRIQSVTDPSAADLSAYPAATASIVVSYYNQNQVFTGNYLIGPSSIGTYITAINA